MTRCLGAVLLLAALAAAPAAGTPEQAPKRGGTLDVVTAIEPACLNVLVDPCQRDVLPVYGVIEGAFKIGPDLTRHPRLVSGVDYTTKPPFTLTYHIRPEARWSDGPPVTARDFVFTYKARLKFPPPFQANPYETIRSVRALGAKTLRVVLRSRLAFW